MRTGPETRSRLEYHGGFSCLASLRPSSCHCSSRRAWASPKGRTSARNRAIRRLSFPRPLLLASRVERVPGVISGQALASVCLAVPSSAVRLGRPRNSALTAAVLPRPDPARLLLGSSSAGRGGFFSGGVLARSFGPPRPAPLLSTPTPFARVPVWTLP